ncbi:MAG: GTPase ObgE [Bdellovibrionaceae bacterium]|jgi:GTPase|nr:GTPase ObgE [Pseudobdellovibrionaceae bacterium]
MKFIDEVEISVGSGKGGAGCVSFRRESKVPRGGPDGGDGGRGGHVIFRVDPGVNTLLNFKFKRKYLAQNGQPGQGSKQSGLDGQDMLLEVPKGTLVLDEFNEILLDLQEGDATFLEGGMGGKGNTFYKSSVNQAPTVAQKGMPGEERKIRMELKLIADVGLVGFPNAGKSTLISHLSKARPKIADYPFTTLKPNLGVVPCGETSFVMADIPGIIEGAHKGLGLGIQFLKHIERTKMFLFVLDLSDLNVNDVRKDFDILRNELKSFEETNKSSFSQIRDDYISLQERPFIVVLNKIDACSEDKLEDMRNYFLKLKLPVATISAVTGQNLSELVYQIGGVLFGSKSE